MEGLCTNPFIYCYIVHWKDEMKKKEAVNIPSIYLQCESWGMFLLSCNIYDDKNFCFSQKWYFIISLNSAFPSTYRLRRTPDFNFKEIIRRLILILFKYWQNSTDVGARFHVSSFLGKVAFGRWCGSVGRAVASYIRDPQFGSSHRQILFTLNYIKFVLKRRK